MKKSGIRCDRIESIEKAWMEERKILKLMLFRLVVFVLHNGL